MQVTLSYIIVLPSNFHTSEQYLWQPSVVGEKILGSPSGSQTRQKRFPNNGKQGAVLTVRMAHPTTGTASECPITRTLRPSDKIHAI